MVLLIAGGSHTGKTLLAQRLLERYHWPYLSLDHLKMGLIRSGYCPLTPYSSSEELTRFLWPITREMIRTNLENHQNLIVEGCYLPMDYRKDFGEEELAQIRSICLVFSEGYIREHISEIMAHANDIEVRLADDCTQESLIQENRRNLDLCHKYGWEICWIDSRYEVNWTPEASATSGSFERSEK